MEMNNEGRVAADIRREISRVWESKREGENEWQYRQRRANAIGEATNAILAIVRGPFGNESKEAGQ